MRLRNTMPGGRSQTRKVTCYMIPWVGNVQKRHTCEAESWFPKCELDEVRCDC